MFLLAVAKEMLQYGEITARKEYAVTLVILLKVGLLHAPILERNTRNYTTIYLIKLKYLK